KPLGDWTSATHLRRTPRLRGTFGHPSVEEGRRPAVLGTSRVRGAGATSQIRVREPGRERTGWLHGSAIVGIGCHPYGLQVRARRPGGRPDLRVAPGSIPTFPS